jgi:hypothetical protein
MHGRCCRCQQRQQRRPTCFLQCRPIRTLSTSSNWYDHCICPHFLRRRRAVGTPRLGLSRASRPSSLPGREQMFDRDPALVLRTPRRREALPECARSKPVSPACSAWSIGRMSGSGTSRGGFSATRLLLALFALPGFAGSELLDLDGADIDLDRQTLPGSRYGSAVGRNTARSPMLRRGRLFSLERLVRAVSTKEERCRPTASPCRPPATTRRTS